jgi:hypothetical protein
MASDALERYLVAVTTKVSVAVHAEQPAELRVTAPDGDRWVRAMKFLILIQFTRSAPILAWNGEPGPGVLSRRLTALRFWPSCQRRWTGR